MTSELRQRATASASVPAPAAGLSSSTSELSKTVPHPSGKEKHGRLMQLARGAAFGSYFITCAIAIHLTQIIGSPLYWIDRDWFYSYMALTKQSFGILITTMTNWWAPTTIRISGDASVAGQMKKRPDGLVEFSFPERLVLIANHQIYTDWLYLWWVGYANNPSMHGFIYIIMRENLKYIPLVGPGSMFYNFIFMSRKMATDQPRLAYRLRKLSKESTGPDGNAYLNPMWLLLFPEGTNLSNNGRAKSAKWAEKIGVKDPEHVLLPRSTGMFFCLNELKKTVEYIYDCTVAYEGVPRGGYGEEYFSLVSTYLQGRPPKSVNFHWRRFRIADIPLDDPEKFELWLRRVWYEKDAMMEQYVSTGRLPPLPSKMGSEAKGEGESEGGVKGGYIETEVRTEHWWEFIHIFAILGIVGILVRLVWTTFSNVWHTLSSGAV